jgi:ribonuclease HI
LKQLALETLNIQYPSEKWLRVYTDGSLTVEGEGVGAGVYSELFSHYSAVGKNKIVFEGEYQAILYALIQLLYQQRAFENVVILVDSKSVIQGISSIKIPKTQTVLEI